MRLLILAGALGLALPASAADDSAPTMEATAPAVVAPSADSATGDAVPRPTPQAAGMTEPEPAAVAQTPPPLPPSAVARGTFATAIDQREPVDSIDSLSSDHARVYYFNEFIGISGRQVTHRWAYEGEVVAEVPIAIDGPRWRAYSSKTLDPNRLGEWTVSVVDESGRVILTDSLEFEAAAPEPEIAAEVAPSAVPVTPPAAPAASSDAPAESPPAPASANAPEPKRAAPPTPQR